MPAAFAPDARPDDAAGSRATIARESGQGREAAALSETDRVPRVAWPPREEAAVVFRSPSDGWSVSVLPGAHTGFVALGVRQDPERPGV